MTPLEPFITTGEVAQLFQVNPETIRRWAEGGLIPSYTNPAGRLQFRRSELQPALERAGMATPADVQATA